MKPKPASRPRRRSARTAAKRTGVRRATTLSLDPRLQKGLALLSEVRKVPVNRLVDEAVSEYLASRAATVEAELEAALRRFSSYRQADPDFESAISKFADAEARFGIAEPIEGRTTRRKGRGKTVSEAVLEDRR